MLIIAEEEGRYSTKINNSRTNTTNCSFLHSEMEFEILENFLFEACFDLRSNIRISTTVISNLKRTFQFPSHFRKFAIFQTKYRNTPNFPNQRYFQDRPKLHLFL